MLTIQRIMISLNYWLSLLLSSHLVMQRTPLTSPLCPSHLSVCAQTTRQLLSIGLTHGLYLCYGLQNQLSFQALTLSFVLFFFFPLLGSMGSIRLQSLETINLVHPDNLCSDTNHSIVLCV